MTKKIIIFFLILTTYSCGQKQSEKNDNNMTNKTFYFIDFSYNQKCGFAIYVNDVLVKRYSKPVNIDYAITPINPYILESGKQDIKVILFPFENKELEPDIEFYLKVFYIEDYNQEVIDANTIKNIVFELPKIDMESKTTINLEYKNSFIAKVPYKVEGWRKSKNLTDLPDINRKVTEKFESLSNELKNKNVKEFTNSLSKSMKESESFYYLTNQQIEESIRDLDDVFTLPKIDVAPLNNTVIKFYGNGKLVTLETIDGKDALRVLEEEAGRKRENSFPILLHIPENSNELEVIR
ncbi:hypothetical protein [Empedobacter tilapiae]|uniref:hypothetical protein n=1 Tax=Empedobacter tilapiae TaxID=2491114 RepID=UPI0028D6E1A2|nr:hypothetical protein [Empedobacter tilapiae]